MLGIPRGTHKLPIHLVQTPPSWSPHGQLKLRSPVDSLVNWFFDWGFSDAWNPQNPSVVWASSSPCPTSHPYLLIHFFSLLSPALYLCFLGPQINCAIQLSQLLCLSQYSSSASPPLGYYLSIQPVNHNHAAHTSLF